MAANVVVYLVGCTQGSWDFGNNVRCLGKEDGVSLKPPGAYILCVFARDVYGS
jgi:hypothetical protein